MSSWLLQRVEATIRLPCAGLSFWWLLLLRGMGSREFQELQLMGSVAAAPGLWRTDSVAVVCVLS